jgi:hypothetical protein
MPAKKGTKPPNAGKRGRKPGTPNKVTRTTRELFSAFVDHNAEKAQALFDRVARKNPAMALRLLASFAEFSLPRLQRTELDATIGQKRVYPAFADMDVGDASEAYFDLIKSPPGTVEFAEAEEKTAEETYAQLMRVGSEDDRRFAERARAKRTFQALVDAGRAMEAAERQEPTRRPALEPPQPRAEPPEPVQAPTSAEAPAAGPSERSSPARAPSPVALDPNDPSIVAVVNKEDEILRYQRPAYIVT